MANQNVTNERLDSERLQTLYAVSDVLKQIEAEGLNINAILPSLLSIAANQLSADDGSIIVVNQALEMEHASWLHSSNPNTNFLNEIMERGLAGRAVRSREAYIINDTRTDPLWLPRPDHPTTAFPWSVICTPFVVRNRAVGAITLHKKGLHQFGEDDLNLLTAISSQTAVTIENARLYEQSQRQLKIADILYNASKVINSSLDINKIMQVLLSKMNELLNAEALSIALVDPQTNELVYQVAEGIGSEKIVDLRLPANQGLSGWVMQHGEPALVNDAAEDARFDHHGDKRTGYETHAMICAPMQFKKEVLGTIQAINPFSGVFTRQDLELLVNLANIASSAITNAKQFARAQEAEARYTSLFQDSIDPIVLTNRRGRIVEANANALEFFNYPREKLLGKTIADLHVEKQKLPTISDIPEDGVINFTSQVVSQGERILDVHVYTKRTTFGNSELVQWIHHDITQQIELERMRDDLTAMLFHDLQSPLGNVISSLELMRYEIPEEPGSPLYSMLDIAIRSSSRLQTLIRSLLDINQLEAGHPVSELKDVHLDRIVQEVWEMEEPNFTRRGVAFETRIGSDIPPVYVEEDMIRRVLVNLIDNALKHSHENKKIEVAVARTNGPDNNKLLISVSDQGPGIPPDYRKIIFDKFQRVQKRNRKAKGLGLGLAFCRLAVEAHGGQIWVDDAPGGGARFSFTLPINTDSAAG